MRRALRVGLILVVLAAVAISIAEAARHDRVPELFPFADDPTPTPAVVSSAPGLTGVFVEPDDGRAPIIEELDAARSSITLQMYLLTDDEIIAALSRAAARDVQVRVMLEEHPFGGGGGQQETFDLLADSGIEVRWGNPDFQFNHIKTFVVDRAVAIIMNLNLTRSAFTINRDFGVITTKPAEVAQAAAIFEADWRRSRDEPDGPLVVSPERSRGPLLDLFDSAQASLDIYAEVFGDEEVTERLVAAAERGVRVRVLFSADSVRDDRGRDDRATLARGGVAVNLSMGYYIHAKVIIVDQQRAYIGSQNFSRTSLEFNRELGVIVSDPLAVGRLNAVFAGDWRSAVPERLDDLVAIAPAGEPVPPVPWSGVVAYPTTRRPEMARV